MKLSKTLLFAILTLVLTYFVYELEYKKSVLKENEEQGLILKFNPEQISYFQVVKPDIKLALQRSETGWSLLEPIFEAADTDKIEELIGSLFSEKRIAVVKKNESSLTETELKEYGLDKPIATFIFKNNSGLTQKIVVGSLKNFEGQSYLHIDSSNLIILGTANWYNRAQEGIISYRDKRLFRENISRIEKIKINNFQHQIELVKVNNVWKSSDHNYELDQSKIREIIKKIIDSTIEEYAFEGEPSLSLLKQHGLETTAVSLELFTDNTSWLAKMNINKNNNGLYLLSDRPTYLAKTSPLIWEAVSTVSLDSLRDRTSAFVFRAEEVKKIYYKNHDRESNFIFNSGSWLMGSTNSPYLEVDKEGMVQTIKRIHDLRISEFIDTDVKDKFVGQNMLILKSDTDKLLLQLNWGPQFILEKNGNEQEHYYARTHLSEKIFALDKSEIENLNLAPDKVVKKSDKAENVNNVLPVIPTEK